LRGILFHAGERKLELIEDRAVLEDWPNRSCRSLAMVNFICSIYNARARASALTFRRATCAAITIALSVAISSGRESGVSPMRGANHKAARL
jgi:hypothetical protein